MTTKAKLTIEMDVEVVLDGEIKKSGNGGYVGVLNKYIGRKAKVLILK